MNTISQAASSKVEPTQNREPRKSRIFSESALKDKTCNGNNGCYSSKGLRPQSHQQVIEVHRHIFIFCPKLNEMTFFHGF